MFSRSFDTINTDIDKRINNREKVKEKAQKDIEYAKNTITFKTKVIEDSDKEIAKLKVLKGKTEKTKNEEK